MYGLIGKKVKMTQIFNENGHVVPVTLVEAGPCTVSQIKEEKDNGYNAVQLAYGKKSKNNTNKPIKGHLSKSGLETAKVLACLLYTSPSPRDNTLSRMPSSA